MWHVGSLFPNQGLNPHPLQWKCELLATGSPGKSPFILEAEPRCVRNDICERGRAMFSAKALFEKPHSCPGPCQWGPGWSAVGLNEGYSEDEGMVWVSPCAGGYTSLEMESFLWEAPWPCEVLWGRFLCGLSSPSLLLLDPVSIYLFVFRQSC